MEAKFIEARYWSLMKKDLVRCTLCPKSCVIAPGKAGFCSIRKNIGGRLFQLGYGNPSGFAVDPIEKKPLYHFLPGSACLSFGTYGCNMGCQYCQNWFMSKDTPLEDFEFVAPEDVVDLAEKQGCRSISYTYNEPTIFFEYVIDIARIAKERGIKNVIVTNGFTMPEPRKEWTRYIDAANVDLKAYTEEFYRKYTMSMLKDVLETIKYYYKNMWLEVTNLMIPTLNDSEDETKKMCRWLLENTGKDLPLHFTAFHPDFKMRDLPRTPADTLFRAREIAKNTGFEHVYCGNIDAADAADTFCPSCDSKIIERSYMHVTGNRLVDGHCPDCKEKIKGVWR